MTSTKTRPRPPRIPWIDPPSCEKGERRCHHDMLAGQCAWCKGLPDIPDSEILAVLDEPVERRAIKWLRIDGHGITCKSCDGDLPHGRKAAWSPSAAGLVCEDCVEADDQ